MNMVSAPRLPNAFVVLAAVTIAALAMAVAVGGAAGAPASSAASVRCVGMFVASPGSGGLPRSVAATASNLTIRGTVPCRDAVMAWAPQGPYRVFEDGSIEFLASPIPPCDGGDYYVWIGFPK
jgi:hypothetical protein